MYYESKAQYTFSSSNGTFEAVVPADLATIYNFNPLFNAGYSGQGQTVTVVEDSDVYSTSDWTKFRSEFGLSGYKGAFKVVHPTGSSSCEAPGVQGAEGEAILDAEWASAAAPSATIQLAACKDTKTTFGGLIALQNLINSKTPPAIISLSYGVCEAVSGAAQNAAFEKIYQQAVALGSSVFVSSGDQNAAVCDRGNEGALHGIAVNGWGSTVYNVSVGGTDFGDTYANTNATYWTSTNTKYYGSAKSYVPEIPWNYSCASVLISTYLGYKTPYGASGFCNSSEGTDFYQVVGGSGGPSGCATGVPKTAGVVSGTCKGYAKPSWQVVLGNPKDGVRDLPDVSLFAASGLWGHYYVFCDSNPSDGETCTGAPSGWAGAGGTSFASPIMAGVQALINQYKKTSKAGNPAPTLYKLAAAEFGTAGTTKCNGSLGNKVSSTCVFYDTRLGDNDVDCVDYNCYLDGASVGVLSTSTTKYAPAYATGNGWDFATGLGSVNVTNLVKGW
jgi:subtilase family serine protease